MSAVIKVSHLSKQFRDVKAVDDLSFSVEEGAVYGFLGQNGAGKSTTIRMLLTLIQPDEGQIEIFGMDLAKHRYEILKHTGAIIERPDLYKYLTALENLRIFAAVSGIKLTDRQLMDQLAAVGLAERAKSRVKTYSQGMKQRLGIATALVHNPKLIILDEPVNGLDPQGIADIRNLILQLSNEQGKTVLVSSHLLNEVELIADSLLIIDKGKKVAEGTKDELLHPAQTQVELITADNSFALQQIRSTNWINALVNNGEGPLILQLDKTQVPEFNKMLVEKGVKVISLRPRHSLEDVFLSLTGR